MRETAATKANRILAEGRLILTAVTPARVEGTCRGEGRVYRISFWHGVWRCECPVTTDQCSHLRAVRKVVAIDIERWPHG